MLINTNNHHHHSDYAEKMQRLQEYFDGLEEEKRKIQVFQRELPLCLELVTQAIEACRQQMCASNECFHGQSEWSEQTSSEGPVIEEFIPIRRNSSSDDDEDEKISKKCRKNSIDNNNERDSKSNNDKFSKKSDWLRSVQLWNQTPDPPITQDSPRKVSVVEVKRNGTGGAFHPFKREKSVRTTPPSMGGSPPATAPVAAASSTAETGGSSGGGGHGESKTDEKEGESQRKARRCWSPELHRRFLQALQELGGSHVATPKQIRELMKVDGLTNDEVKSHLQKYRLHTRRPSPSMHSNNNTQAPQFVVVGGIWVPPPEYASMAAKTAPGEASRAATSNEIYAPIAAHPPPHQDALASINQSKQLHSDDRGSLSEGRILSNSPATSSSTHTTTASPAY